MAIRDDSYGSVDAVKALTRHLLDGAATFSAQTRPTLADVEAIIDRWSAVLNVALINLEVTTPVTHEATKLVCDLWVIRQAAAEVELTQRGTGWNEDENSRIRALRMADGAGVAASVAAALRQVGVTSQGAAHSGLTFTGLPVQGKRPDSGNPAYEQPLFSRRQFDA